MEGRLLDTAAKESEIDAYAVPWAICVTVLAPQQGYEDTGRSRRIA